MNTDSSMRTRVEPNDEIPPGISSILIFSTVLFRFLSVKCVTFYIGSLPTKRGRR
jgi:hypothetical protein